MNETAQSPLPDDAPDSAEGKEGRQRSTIGFPYSDMENAEEVAKTIFANVGTGTCSAGSQLAAWMGQSAKSSSFRTQLAAARMFGLIESDDAESYRLTELGRRLVDPEQTRAAKVESFLKVPLFKALYEKYKATTVPPTAALEREIVALGVSDKQKARARQVFDSSADYAGYKQHGSNKLVMPGIVGAGATDPAEKPKNGGGDGGGGGAGGGKDSDLLLDPLLLALLRKIPHDGEEWPAATRLRWFRTFAMNVSQVYDAKDPVELKIDISKVDQSPFGS